MDQRSWHHQNDQSPLPPSLPAQPIDHSPPPPSSPAQPIEGLPPFLIKTFEMVDDLSTADIVYWNRGGHSFVVWDYNAFSTIVLPTYFKHNNFSSFVRQLNTYGFKKIDAEKWEFANDAFVRGQKHLLKNIKRRGGPTHPSPFPDPTLVDPYVELGQFGQEAEVDRLRRDKQVLMMELVKLRQENQDTRLYVQQVQSRVHGTEKKQKQMMRFLVNAMQNPDFIRQLVQYKEKKKELEKWRPVEDGETNQNNKELNLVKVGHGGFEVSELEALALEMRGLPKAREEGRSRIKEVEVEVKESEHYGFEVSELEALALEMQGIRKVREEERSRIKEVEVKELGHYGFEVSELEALALEMQGLRKAREEGRPCIKEDEVEVKELGNLDKELDEGFWEGLLNQGFNGAERLMAKNEEGEEEDHHVNVLANRFGFLGSTSRSNIS